MHHFATQLRPGQQTTLSLRASHYQRSTKRKRDEDDEEPPISPNGESTDLLATSNTQSVASFIPLESAHQLRVAGLLPGDEVFIPPSPFPHAPTTTSRSHLNSAKVQKEIASLPSPLYAVNATSKLGPGDGPSETTALKQTHLDVLSTVMHRCLLEGDYDRAGRAWGMILRTHVSGGRPIDPRNHGRWGIGAEILLHHNTQNERNRRHSDQNTAGHLFSEEGFELAREYYERLILQHPHRKQHPRTIDERTFYPAMFSLWIFEVCEKGKWARRKAEAEARRLSISTEGDTTTASVDARAREDAVQVEELARATEIAERLDQLIISPPFDKDANLLRLRGMVSLWMSDLIMGKKSKEQDEDWTMDTNVDHLSSISDSPAEKRSRLRNCQQEVQQAKTFFQRAEETGARQETKTISDTEIRLKELATQLARLEAR